MATRHHRVPISEQQRGIGGVPPGKQQKAPAGGNRRALGDIGNLVNGGKARADEAKPQPQISRPVTRSFGALLLKNAQAAADVANVAKKPVKLGADRAKEQPKIEKPTNVEKPTAVEEKPTEISSQESSTAKKRSSRKKVHTFSSVLSARSKMACGIPFKPAEIVHDIDAADACDQLAVVDYVEDIYKFYKHSENTLRPRDYMGSQIEINAKMRAILVDWLIEVHHKFELMPETLYLAVYIIDRYLSLETVLRRELQLVGMSSMLIACKYEEIWAPEVYDFICISDNAYSREQILAMEKTILDKLEWNITVPTPYVFLVRFIKAAAPSDVTELENMAFFFAELGLMQYNFAIPYCASMVAAAAVYAARCTLKKGDDTAAWSETLRRHAGFSEEEVRECARLLVELHQSVGETKLKAAFKKYSNPRLGSVALYPPAMKTMIK
ncbi:G2/mitotic-specific cyclin S13-7-like [Wolffia australiana]